MSFLDSTGVATLTADIKSITDATYPANAAIATEYDSTASYSVGDCCMHGGLLYVCSTAIASGGETWNSSHWTQVNATSLCLPYVSSSDNGKVLQVSSGAWSVETPASGLPSVTSSDNGKVLRVNNGSWTVELDGMTILSYGSSTWSDFINAYNANKVVYCRASSNSNPATGAQGRMAFMAYVNANPPTNVEFQYYRSVNSHSATQQGDQTYVYKLEKTSGWSVTVRENYTKIVAGTGINATYNSGVLTISLA